MSYFVNWIRGGKAQRFAYEHADLESALEFACEAFVMDCGDVWGIDERGQTVAEAALLAAKRLEPDATDRYTYAFC